MTLVTLRPNGVVSSSGSPTVVGAASANAALADDSDSSYVEFDTGDQLVVGFADLTLPGGAVVKSVGLRVRDFASATGIYLTAQVNSAGAPSNGPAILFTTAPANATTFASGLVGTDWTDPLIDAATLAMSGTFFAGGALRIVEAYLDARIVNQPVVTVIAPTGTVTNTSTPRTQWSSANDFDGGGQTQYEVKIFSAAQYGAGGFDPATSTPTVASAIKSGGAFLWDDTVALANATYRSYVRTAQTVNGVLLWSAWAFSQFILNVAVPNAPTLAVTAASSNGRNSALITPSGAGTTTDRVELQRSVDGGTTWLPVRNTQRDDGTFDTTAATTILDYEAPNGTLCSYRARSLHNYSGIYAAGAWSTTATATWSATDWWIKHPNIPALNLRLTKAMFSYANVERVARQTAFQPLGAALPVVVSDTRGGATGSVVLQLATLAEQNALDALLDTVGALLLQGPVAEGHPDRYVRFGDHAAVRTVDKSWALQTTETVPWTQVAVPAGAQT